MWIFTVDGMLSIVKHRDVDDCFLVRSRTPVVLERRFPEYPVICLEDADYRYRVVVPWEQLMCELMSEMNSLFHRGYPNFKEACGRWLAVESVNPMCKEDLDYLEALGRVWEVMRDYQETRESTAR